MATKVITDPQKIEELLLRGVEDIFIKEHLHTELLSGRQLRIKLGIDPTGPKIHIGRAIALRKLKAFQDLGHQIVLIVGDFTAKIGDPSDKLEKRPMLTDDIIQENLKTYIQQIGKIIDISKTEIRYNSEWLASMNYLETAKLLECFTVQQMSRRRNFRDRLDAGQDIFVVEFMYPALQGYDSVMVDADVEIGGFDQLFNLKAGRTVQKKYGKKEQDIMTLVMLEGTDGRKMSTSWGNIITIVDEPNDMYAKIMALNDDLIIKYFTLCTNISLSDIEKIEQKLHSGINPRDIKMNLAKHIVGMYHNKEIAEKAEENFISVFQKKETPDELERIAVKRGEMLINIVVESKIVESKGEFRRLIDGGAITDLETGDKITDSNYTLMTSKKIKIGKRRFVEIITE